MTDRAKEVLPEEPQPCNLEVASSILALSSMIDRRFLQTLRAICYLKGVDPDDLIGDALLAAVEHVQSGLPVNDVWLRRAVEYRIMRLRCPPKGWPRARWAELDEVELYSTVLSESRVFARQVLAQIPEQDAIFLTEPSGGETRAEQVRLDQRKWRMRQKYRKLLGE